ncbi:hypothetical protein P3T18_004340 [Paraburkholderia sp. GAS199]|uniref:DUF1488 family protein n=1 Tax=Paraburkholderia sp. GAS199 TaxID=3035126 RepID=UPI003D1BF581
MDAIELAPEVAQDQREIVFRLAAERREVVCAIMREALEEHFWLPNTADQLRMLKVFADGRRRILAVAERKSRLHRGEFIRLTADDFRLKR